MAHAAPCCVDAGSQGTDWRAKLCGSSPGLNRASWIGEGGDFHAGADAVPGAWRALTLLCTGSTGKGLREKVCRCWGPAEPLGAAILTPSLQSIRQRRPRQACFQGPGRPAVSCFTADYKGPGIKP